MKDRKFLKFEVFSTFIVIILGILLHFLYDWSNKNIIVSLFSAVNESTWEHLKLLFFPMLITIILGKIYLKEYSNYLCVKTKGLFLGLGFIIIFFYTYTGILGFNISIIDIGTFFIAVLLSEYYTYKNINDDSICHKNKYYLILATASIIFFIFTFFPPNIGLFKDPISNSYGLIK